MPRPGFRPGTVVSETLRDAKRGLTLRASEQQVGTISAASYIDSWATGEAVIPVSSSKYVVIGAAEEHIVSGVEFIVSP